MAARHRLFYAAPPGIARGAQNGRRDSCARRRQRDAAAGLNTAGFISGYRGSPLSGLDQNLWQAERFLEQHHIRFLPGINEDLAATAVWGSQQTNLFPDAKYDGVFALWYGKGPGVDRTGDVFK